MWFGRFDNDVRALERVSLSALTYIIAKLSGDTMLEGHGVDHLARREHVDL
jgi:hypothetical protein